MVIELQGDAVFGHGPNGVGIESIGQGGMEIDADPDLDTELAVEVLDDFFGELGHLWRDLGRANGYRAMEGQIVARVDSFSKVAQLARNAELAAFVPTGLATRFPQDDYTRYLTDAFNALSRSFVLAAAESALSLRPALQRIFDQMARILGH